MSAKKVTKKHGFDKYILNCLPSPKQEKNWGVDAAASSGILTAPAQIPSTVDLRAAWWKVGDQGSTGSCVGWGSADGVLRWHFVKANRLNQKELLSVRFIWMASKETDIYTARPETFIEQAGTWCTAALDIARKYGIVTGTVLPFQNPSGSPELYTGNENTFFALASQRKIASYFNLGTGTPSQANWRNWIATVGPILTRLDVDPTWDNATTNHGNLDTYDTNPNHHRGGHCVAIVGYTPTRFIVRNSWGTTWGDQGFGYASLQYAAAAFTEAYGVTL
jgi:C1A family cysteine protease